MDCARENNIVIGEVGVWKNPISLDEKEAKANLEYCKERLALVEELGACCCVNITGARERYGRVLQENYDEDVYALIVDTIRI